MNKKDLLDRCARSGEERVLLARVMDKLELAQNRGVPAHTPFLSPGERGAVEDLLRLCGPVRSLFWGGYPDAERTAATGPSGSAMTSSGSCQSGRKTQAVRSASG